MARTRIKEAPAFRSWHDVDAALREIAELEIGVAEIEGEMNKQIAGAKLSAQQEAKPLQDRIAVLGREIKMYTEDHREDLDGRKTKELHFGRAGFRLSTQVRLPRGKEKLAAVIAALKARRMTDCIKTTETVNKEALKRYSEDKVVAVGASLKKEDTFWYEADHEKLVPTQG